MVLLTRREAAARAKLCLRTFDIRIAEPDGPPITRLGKRVFIDADALDAWLRRNTAPAVAAS